MKSIAIAIILLLAAGVVFAADETIYVNTDAAGGGDGTTEETAYNGLQAALTAEARDFASVPGKAIFEVWGDTTDTTVVSTWTGWANPTATDYIWIYVRPAARHTGSRDAGKYLLSVSNNFSGVIVNPPAYTVIEGLQLTNTGTSSDAGITWTAANVTIKDCLIYACGADALYCNASGGKVVQCVVLGCGYGARLASSKTLTLVNSTILNCTTGAYASTWSTMTAINTYAGCTTGFVEQDGNSNLNPTTCASSDGSLSTTTVALSTDTFTNVTSGGENVHLVAGSGLIGAGVDASAYTSLDVDGDSRPQNTTWDVGADEYVGAAAGPSDIQMWWARRRQ